MATGTLERPTYEGDYYAWALDQAARLRAMAALRPNDATDWELLAEEVEGLARSDRRAVESQVERLIEHLWKLERAPWQEPRRQWLLSIDDARREIEARLTAVLRRELEAALPDLYLRQRRRLARKLAAYGDDALAEALPATCPYTLRQILDEGWYPPEARVEW
jgi:hypothetical protein